MAKTTIARDGLSPSVLLNEIYAAHPDWRGTLEDGFWNEPAVMVQFTAAEIFVTHPDGADISSCVAAARARVQ